MITKFRQLSRAIATALILSAAPALAQEITPEHLDLARKYVELTDRASVFEAAVVRTGVDVLKLITKQNPDIANEIDVAVGEVIKSYKGRKGELLDQFARVYAQRLTMEELKAVVAFYESDVGQKLSQQNFEANQQIRSIMGIFQRNLSTELLASVRAELKEKGFDV